MNIPTAKECRVMNILRKSRKPLSHADLMQAANVSDAVVREALGYLYDQRQLVMGTDGPLGYYGQYTKIVYSVKGAE